MMSKSIEEKIKEEALRLLEEAKIKKEALRLLEEAGPEGMKTSEIVKDIHSKVEDKSKTAKWVWWKMHDKTHKDKITKIKHGLYRLSKFDDINSREVNDGDRPPQKNNKAKITHRIREAAMELLEKAGPGGMRTTELQDAVYREVGGNPGTIQSQWHGMISNKHKSKITRIERGSYRLSKFDEAARKEKAEGEVGSPSQTYEEEKYYKPFADYLKEVIEECDVALPIGGSKLGGGTWGNPDVIAAKKFQTALNVPPIIVTAEIKARDTSDAIIKGFGQCCSYKLFSHKVYLVVPKSPRVEGSLADMCKNHQIGLVVFNKDTDIDNPGWDMLLQAPMLKPDYSELSDLYDRLLTANIKDIKALQNIIK